MTVLLRRFCCSVVAAGRQLAPGRALLHNSPSMLKRRMVKIGTHSGSFHCDEALGCFLLTQTAAFQDGEVVRSRNPDVLKDLDVVIDVGGEYSPEQHRYDHHQRGFDHVFGNGFTTKLSSAGLVYKHFGREIIAKLLGLEESHPNTRTVYLAVYKHFMEAIDGIDNGVSQYDTKEPPKYLSSTNLSSRVGSLNPRWNEDDSEAVTNERFAKAMQLTGSEFLEAVDYFSKCWLPARGIVQQAVEGRFEVDGSGEVMQLEAVCPWKEHLYDLEQELRVEKPIKYCIYKDTRENKWRVQAVSVSPGGFESRKPLPAAWRGLRDEALQKESGIPGCVFVHASGFIGGNDTRSGAILMAVKGLTLE